MFRPYMWAIFRLCLDYRISYTGMRGSFYGSSGGGGGRDLIIPVGTMAPGFIRRVTISSFVVPLFFKVCTTLMLGIQYKYNSSARIIVKVQT